MAEVKLVAPFPYFGGKRRVASSVWARLGNPGNYVEPFAGSLAVLLARETEPRSETVNDLDCAISNFWRAIKADPHRVAAAAEWPINEADLHARHQWLTNQLARDEFRERMKTDPFFFDAHIAGWWVWGISQWIGSGWCVHPEWRGRFGRTSAKRPNMKRGGAGVYRQIPVSGAARGAGRGDLVEWFDALCTRLSRVRVCCGDWTRVLTPSVTTKIGLTGVLLDPPYATDLRHGQIYGCEGDFALSTKVANWAIQHGDDPKFRIALCGYDGEHQMPSSWSVLKWEANGGYGNQVYGRGRENKRRERIWFSPHCLEEG